MSEGQKKQNDDTGVLEYEALYNYILKFQCMRVRKK